MDFNEYVERRGTGCIKWDGFMPGLSDGDMIPMGIADTDFKCPPEVVEAVIERAKHGVFGYCSRKTPGMVAAVTGWMESRYRWEIEPDWMVLTPGIVPVLVNAVQAFTQPGDGVIIQQPVYHPFRNCVVSNGRVVRNNALLYDGEDYRIDYEQLEELAAEEHTKLMIFCNPHNPVGRVWSREEVARICEICGRHDVILVSDEIHADLLMKGVEFCPTGPVAQEYGVKCVSCYAPSKTFNVAGLQASVILVPDAGTRAGLERQLKQNDLPGLNVFACVALETAWTKCAWYIDEVMEYVEGNMDYMADCIRRYMPRIKFRKPQGTYLAWIDLRDLGMTPQEAESFLSEKAGINANKGSMFGEAGTGFMRLNLGCHRSILEKAMEQLRAAYEGLPL